MEKDLDDVQKQVEFQVELRDIQSAIDVTVSAESPDSITVDSCFEFTEDEASTWSAKVDEIERQLDADIKIDNLGVVETTSGMEMQRETTGRNIVSTLLAAYYKLSSMSKCTWMEVEQLSHASHASVVGCLNYAMDNIRLDLLHVIRKMYTINPGIHCNTVKWILLVLLRTTDIGLCFGGCSSSSVVVTKFVNLSHAGNLNVG